MANLKNQSKMLLTQKLGAQCNRILSSEQLDRELAAFS